jgi:hypothetical protein
MSIGFPQSIINSQTDPLTLSAYPVVNIRDVNLAESVSASLTADINEDDIIVLQKMNPVDSANVVSLTVSGLKQVIGAGSMPVDWTDVSATGTFVGDGSGLTGFFPGNYLPLSGGIVTGVSYFTDGLSATPSLSSNIVYLNSIKNYQDNGGIYVNNKGFVGIGTATDPIYHLHIASAGVTRVLVQSTDNNQASFDMWVGTTYQSRW